MSEQTLPRDPILTEEVRDLTWRIWLLENCDGVDERLKRFIAWARERDSRAVKPLRNQASRGSAYNRPPGMSSCKAVARAIVEMSGGVDNVRCVVAYGIGDERGQERPALYLCHATGRRDLVFAVK